MVDKFNWNTTVSLIANSRTTEEHDALMVKILEALQTLKDLGLINYADYTVSQSFQKIEGKVG